MSKRFFTIGDSVRLFFSGSGKLEKIHDMLVKNETPSVGIIDSQSVKTTQKGAGKKIKGRERHIVVDTVGLVIMADVHSASVQDRHVALDLFIRAKVKP